MGTTITYSCPAKHVFASDWLRAPFLKLTCQTDGTFGEPDEWDPCINREQKLIHNI